ncbi:MAG: glycosyltransferase family 2 protein [Candidatus Yanofskybacteria bacterium]|nr:glycosyltransferase family 2 protein [Candidatus Yanofskybacteria bacterium]
MSSPLVTINLAVLNGGKYIRHCLESVLEQTYSHEFIELNILDNGSTDKTKDIISEWQSFDKLRMPKFTFIKSKVNLGMWPGQEELLKHSAGKYIVVLAVDVILDENFLNNAIRAMEKDEKIGALQPKVFKYDLADLETVNRKLETKIIDTCGFEIYKSRRIINIGNGETDTGQFDREKEIFAVEGAVPVFRKDALEKSRIEGELVDHDYFWYSDDLDIAWRMRVFGWKQLFAPDVIAWHDRQTSKSSAAGKWWWNYIPRVKARHQIPIKKRGLEWRNTRFTIIKNDYTINLLKDLPQILWREIKVFGYTVVFEPKVFLEVPMFLRLLSKMLKKRKQIMKRRIASPEEMRKWFK